MYSHEQIKKNLNARGAYFQSGADGGGGELDYRGVKFKFVYSFGQGWEHVSVSTKKRCPIWEEMCMFKNIFFPGTEACVQYHPVESDYINCHKYCLHIWRPEDGIFPVPPKEMVGV